MKSSRASLLSQVLLHINSDDYCYGDGFIVFGINAFEEMRTGEEHVTPEDESLRTYSNRIKLHVGRKELWSRRSLRSLTDEETITATVDFLSSLPPEERDQVVNAHKAPAASEASAYRSDALDAALADECVQQLEASYSLINGMDVVAFDAATFNTAAYFEEAHTCYLAGHFIAAAILCRAVTEDALRRTLDPSGTIRGDVPREDSYFEALLHRAQTAAILDSSRIEMAKVIRLAGNKAAHDLSTFQSRYKSRVAELILSMRAILEDLSSGSIKRQIVK